MDQRVGHQVKLLAIDPGNATGWSTWAWSDGYDAPALRIKYGLAQGGYDGFMAMLDDQARDVDVIICEQFHLDGRTAFPDITPKLLEGALLATQRAGVFVASIHWSPTSNKAMVRNAALKRGRLWLTGKKVGWTDANDVNDSQRHALAYLKQIHPPTTAWLWPDVANEDQ